MASQDRTNIHSNPMQLAFPGSLLKASEMALLSVLRHSSNNMESESHPEGTSLGAGGGWETTGAVDFSEALVLPTDKCLAEGSSLLPIRLRDSLSCTLKILENCKSE